MSALPISAQAVLAYNNGAGINIQLPETSSATAVAIAGVNFNGSSMVVPTTSGGTAIPLGALQNLGLACFQNLDPTNYCEILTAVSGTAIIKLNAGDPPFLFRFGPGITAPALIAHTATTLVQWLILEN
jgi:hypothetical protein